ncbi:MAG: carbonic anhydrase [Candidatus Bilamarchaeaceae archaeon]
MNVDEALNKLLEGNKVYRNGKVCFDVGAAREASKQGQKPFATIVSCSDSRVVPEFIFNRNLGEIFVIRTAGNVVDNVCLGTIEYGVEHLHTPLLIILAHEKCGAVTAACGGGHCEGHIKDIVDEIKKHTNQNEVENASVENAKGVVNCIMKKSKIVKKLVDEGKLKIVVMKYYFEDGRVEILS